MQKGFELKNENDALSSIVYGTAFENFIVIWQDRSLYITTIILFSLSDSEYQRETTERDRLLSYVILVTRWPRNTPV